MSDREILAAEQGLREIYYDPGKGYRSVEKLYRKARERGLETSGEGVVGNSGHLHEVQVHCQEAQIPGNLRERPRGPSAAGPGGHG